MRRWKQENYENYQALEEKIKILDGIAAKKRKMSCRDVSEEFNIGKTQASNILKNEATLRKDYESFKGKGFKHLARKSHQIYKIINDTRYTWYIKCEACYPTGH